MTKVKYWINFVEIRGKSSTLKWCKVQMTLKGALKEVLKAYCILRNETKRHETVNDSDDILDLDWTLKVIQVQRSTLGQPVLIGLKFDRNHSDNIQDRCKLPRKVILSHVFDYCKPAPFGPYLLVVQKGIDCAQSSQHVVLKFMWSNSKELQLCYCKKGQPIEHLKLFLPYNLSRLSDLQNDVVIWP